MPSVRDKKITKLVKLRFLKIWFGSFGTNAVRIRSIIFLIISYMTGDIRITVNC